MKKKTLHVFLILTALFMSFSMMSFTQEEEKKAVYVEKETHDFGTINESNGKVSATFVVHNDSDKPITLVSVRASCGCTTPQWSKEPIEPGKTSEIAVSFNPKGRSGAVNKRVTVKTDSGETLVMYIKGIVEK